VKRLQDTISSASSSYVSLRWITSSSDLLLEALRSSRSCHVFNGRPRRDAASKIRVTRVLSNQRIADASFASACGYGLREPLGPKPDLLVVIDALAGIQRAVLIRVVELLDEPQRAIYQIIKSLVQLTAARALSRPYLSIRGCNTPSRRSALDSAEMQ